MRKLILLCSLLLGGCTEQAGVIGDCVWSIGPELVIIDCTVQPEGVSSEDN